MYIPSLVPYLAIPAPTQPAASSASAPAIVPVPSDCPSTNVDVPAALPAVGGYDVGVYYTNWAMFGRQHFVTDLPADKLTRINYAFANVNSTTGEVYLTDEWADLQYPYPGDVATNGTELFGNFGQLYKLKQEHRNLKTILTVGGWSYRENFKTGLATSDNRRRFAESFQGLVADLGLDGIDISWQYPEDDTDAATIIDTVKLCREALDAYSAEYADGYHFDIVISSPAGPIRYNAMPVAELDQYVDVWSLMSYDYMSPGFSNFTGHLSNVYPSTTNNITTDFNTEQAVEHYLANIADPSKLILGLPVYGRSYANTTGIGKTFSGPGAGSWETGVLDYKVLPLTSVNTTTVHTDYEVIGSWSFDSATGQFVSYDTPEVQTLKAKYLQSKNLGGAVWWDSSSDRTDENSLVTTVSNALGGVAAVSQAQNNLYYPNSKYDNIRIAATA
ncbi:Chitinase 4 [Coniothyrium glycines]